MSQRNISEEMLTLIAAELVEPEVFLFGDFPSGAKRYWTGVGTYVDEDGNSWEGIGGIIEIDTIQEEASTTAHGLSIRINGLDSELVDLILGDAYQGRRAEVNLGFWNRATGQVVFPEEPTWRGVLNRDESTISKEGTDLTIECEHRLVDILRKREFRYTSADQKNLYPDVEDTGLDHMESIQDTTIPWGRTQQ